MIDGKKLREVRLQKKLRQTDLAKQAGVSQSLISDFERGKAGENLSFLDRVARELGYTAKDFILEGVIEATGTVSTQSLVTATAHVVSLRSVPVVPTLAHAGEEVAPSDDQTHELVQVSADAGQRLVGFRVTGECMTPEVEPGDNFPPGVPAELGIAFDINPAAQQLDLWLVQAKQAIALD